MHDDRNDQAEDNLPVRDDPELTDNIIELVLNKEAFYDDEEVNGYVNIKIHETFYPKRLTLGIIGEIISQTVMSKKDRSNYKKTTTLLTSIGSPGLGRTFTAMKTDTNDLQSPVKKTVTRTFTRTLTMVTNKSTRASGMSGTKIIPIEEVKNRELFCHYNIPIFTFKTEKLSPGTYKIPFKFMLSSEVLPSFNYNRENFQFNICYTAVAELEENPEADNGDSFYVGDNNLKSRKDLKIFKSSTRKRASSPTSRIANNEVVGRLKLNELLCIRPNENKIKLRLEKNSFRLGDQVNFEVISYDKSLKQNKTKIKLNLLEELNNFGEAVNTFQTPLEVSNLKFEQENDKESTTSKKSTIRGSVMLGGASKKGFRPSNENVEHVFELVLGYKTGFSRHNISLRIPITLKPERNGNEEAETHRESLVLNPKEEEEKEEEEDEDEDVIVLPLAKFKLEERFNVLSKAAQMLEEGF